jgi:hypothetical protein
MERTRQGEEKWRMAMRKNSELDNMREYFLDYLKSLLDDPTTPGGKICAAIYICLCLATKEEFAKGLNAVKYDKEENDGN